MCVYLHAYSCVCVCVHVLACMCLGVHVLAYMCLDVASHVCVCAWCVCVCVHVRTCVCVYVCKLYKHLRTWRSMVSSFGYETLWHGVSSGDTCITECLPGCSGEWRSKLNCLIRFNWCQLACGTYMTNLVFRVILIPRRISTGCKRKSMSLKQPPTIRSWWDCILASRVNLGKVMVFNV